MSILDTVPVVDLVALDHDPCARATLDAACRHWGFFHLVGHGLDPALIGALHAQMHAFFALPAQARRAIERTADNHWGFFDRELTKNRRDAKQIFDVGPAERDGVLAGIEPQWPAQMPEFRRVIECWSAALHPVAGRLLGAIAANLHEPAAPLRAAFEPRHSSFLRLNYYPPGNEPQAALGIHEHTDAGALTLLLQDDVAGLQVRRDGGWHTVAPRRDALVINIGDIVQVWSNDRYPAPLHRVLGSAALARYTAAYFYNPVATLDYAPLPGACSARDPAHYRPINWGAFRAARAAGDYADRGEEVQVDHFRHGAQVPAVYAGAR
jgi:isopenicillin N synthase-like dioxygenase